ncbi:hypothetical protein H0H92_006279 [Tricholoma furcatifolium]|nr:hypothetical protein H0H92_006279 [Tricholoma furcatifolium]
MSTSDGSSTNPNKKMPPGMVMGPDGKPCKICTAFRHWRPGTVDKEQKGGRRTTSTAAMMAALASGTDVAPAPTTSSTPIPEGPPPDCPADVEQLGRATWTFLHTTAAYYPERPTPTQRANMLMLLRSLPLLYPCTNCAEDFGKKMAQHPPDVSGRIGLSKWLCERHNDVNEKLGKQLFDCAKTDERWKDGPADGRCD